MEDRNQKKYRIEKILHEWIKDIPEVKKVAMIYENGFCTPEDALEEIAYQIKRLKG